MRDVTVITDLPLKMTKSNFTFLQKYFSEMVSENNFLYADCKSRDLIFRERIRLLRARRDSFRHLRPNRFYFLHKTMCPLRREIFIAPVKTNADSRK